jgi:hypothetical protein
MTPSRAERRENTLNALKRAPDIIDLTNDDTSPNPAATRSQITAPSMRRSPANHREDLEVLERPPVIDLTDNDADDDADDDDSQRWEPLAVYPISLTLASYGGSTNSFTLKGDHWIDDDGRTLRRKTCHRYVVRVVLKPSNGYPTKFRLRRRGGVFTGKYGKYRTGVISLDREEMKAMVQQGWREGGFVASVWFPR